MVALNPTRARRHRAGGQAPRPLVGLSPSGEAPRRLLCAAIAVAVIALFALSLALVNGGGAHGAGVPGTTNRLTSPALRDPLSGQSLYVNPAGTAVKEEAALADRHDTATASLLALIASQPTGTWFADGAPRLTERVADVVSAARRAGKLPVLVPYYVPDRDCGGYSSGGAPSVSAYLSFTRRFSAGLAGRPAIVILEPDAVAETVQGCLSGAAAAARLALLDQAVGILARDPRANIYIDAGNAGWVSNLRALSSALHAAGIAHAAGFALNVANFRSTASSTAYGDRLSGLLGGAHFVIDTGRNGNGAASGRSHAEDWCNPPGRALGHAPTTTTGVPRVDAYLWVKPPGISDGACRPGAPPAGQWWMSYALGLAANANR